MYQHGSIPFEVKALIEFLSREFPRLATEINNALSQRMVIYHTEPDKPSNGLYYADGSNWDPGSGRGIYRYDESAGAYTFLG